MAGNAGVPSAAAQGQAQQGPAQRCLEQHQFGTHPVDLAVNVESRSVLASVHWTYIPYAQLCYLVLNSPKVDHPKTAHLAAHPIVWQSTGDSFSSGLGLDPYYKTTGSNQDGYCKRSNRAYGPLAAEILRQRGWQISPDTESMTACLGHRAEQYFNDYSRGSSGPRRGLWMQGQMDQGAPERSDVLVMSFGGNDIGFTDLLADTGYINRLNSLLDPEQSCSGLRYKKDEPERYSCDLMIDGDLRGGIDDFYVRVVERALTDTGHLYVVGYPNLIAPYDEWPAVFFGLLRECTIISLPVIGADAKRDLTSWIDSIARHFNLVLKQAVGRANAELGEVRVHYLDLYQLYRTGTHQAIAHISTEGSYAGTHPVHDYGTGGSHEYCGKQETDTWLRGLGEFFLHPNAEAHRATATALADLIEETHPRFDS